MALMLSQLYLETFLEFYDLAKRTQQAGIEFEPLVEIAGFDKLSGWITRPSRRLTNVNEFGDVTGDRWVPDYDVDWENPNISHFKGMIPDEDAFIWWNVFIRLSLFTPSDGYPSLKMRVHSKGHGTEIINVEDFESLKSEMDYIIQNDWRTWGLRLMELCQEWKQFLARDWYPPGLNREMIKILNNIFVFGGDKIPIYLTQEDWNHFVRTETPHEEQWPTSEREPWQTQFSPWQWDWEYVFMSDIQLKYDYELSESDFPRMARGVLETLLQARNPTPVRSLNYPRGL